MKSILTLGPIAAAVLLAACASQQPPPPELLQARSAVQTAGANPQVLANAPLELKKATDTLDRANALNAKGESLAEVASTAYVARRQAETAMAIADAKQNAATIQSAEAERERARADARAADARRARRRRPMRVPTPVGLALRPSRHSSWPRRRGRKPTPRRRVPRRRAMRLRTLRPAPVRRNCRPQRCRRNSPNCRPNRPTVACW